MAVTPTFLSVNFLFTDLVISLTWYWPCSDVLLFLGGTRDSDLYNQNISYPWLHCLFEGLIRDSTELMDSQQNLRTMTETIGKDKLPFQSSCWDMEYVYAMGCWEPSCHYVRRAYLRLRQTQRKQSLEMQRNRIPDYIVWVPGSPKSTPWIISNIANKFPFFFIFKQKPFKIIICLSLATEINQPRICEPVQKAHGSLLLHISRCPRGLSKIEPTACHRKRR